MIIIKIFNINPTDLNNSTREKLQNKLLTILDMKLNGNTRHDSFIVEPIESIIINISIEYIYCIIYDCIWF